jgi:hypothetical protein
MVNLKNQVDDILKSKTSATTKRKKLAELGLPASDIKVLLSLCKTDGAKTAYTFGVEIECFSNDQKIKW